MLLTHIGERQFGAQMQMWQTRGVPIRQQIEKTEENGDRESIFYTDYIQTHDPRFVTALERWGHQYQMAILELSPEMIPCWEILTHLPLEPEERFAFLIAIQHTPAADLDEWRRYLQETRLFIEHHHEQTRRSIEHLKIRAERFLLHPFTKTHGVTQTKP